MSPPGDDMGEMRAYRQFDDATAEALLRGDVVSPEFEPVSEFVRDTRAMAGVGAAPSRELAQRIATGDFTGIQPAAAPTSRPRPANRRGFAGMGARARIATGVAVMLTGFTGVTVAGALPDGAQRTVDSIIETVFPFTVGGAAEPREVADDVDTTESPDALEPAADPEPYSGIGRAGRDDDSSRSSSGAAGTDHPGKKPTEHPGKGKPTEHPGKGKPTEHPGGGNSSRADRPSGKPREHPGGGNSSRADRPSGKPTEHPGGGNSSGGDQTGGKPGNRPAVSGQ